MLAISDFFILNDTKVCPEAFMFQVSGKENIRSNPMLESNP